MKQGKNPPDALTPYHSPDALPAIVETLPPWNKGGQGIAALNFNEAMKGLAAMRRFGDIILYYQKETGMTVKALLADCGCTTNYCTAARYVRIARAADALLIAGVTELPDSATAILSAAKESDCERAEELRAHVDENPEDETNKEIWRKVLAGETPVGRWKAAYEGILKTKGEPRKNMDGAKLTYRSLSSMRSVWDNWGTMPAADKGVAAEAVAATIFGCEERGWAPAPAAVIDEIMLAAKRLAMKRKGQ